MKLQVDGQRLRVRIDEPELAQLLDDQPITARTRFADAFEICFELRLVNADTAKISGRVDHWCVAIPAAAARELATRLPAKEGLRFELATSGAAMLELLFDVDVRDSARRRRSGRQDPR